MKKPLVSVVVITLNEEANIKDCLKSIISSSYKNIELLLVDGGSTDSTVNIASKIKKVRVIKSPKKGMAFQRNYGLRMAKGKYLVSFDADMRMHTKLLENCISICENDEKIGALYVPEYIMGETFFNKVRRFEREFYNATVVDSVRFFRKDIMEKIGYFDENIKGTGEDWDLDKRIKKVSKTALAKYPLYHNETQMTLSRYLGRKRKYTTIMNDYINKYGANDPDIRKQLGFGYRFFGVFFENGKWKKLLIHPILSLSVYGLKVLVGINYLYAKLFLSNKQ
jgi:glycosyltransferase involved in cell wall biosynthesis